MYQLPSLNNYKYLMELSKDIDAQVKGQLESDSMELIPEQRALNSCKFFWRNFSRYRSL